MRRTPTQARALNKVELILEAARRLIERDGLTELNTNRIAELAGVSIGSLYQYFPSKEAIVSELTRQEMARVMQEILDNTANAFVVNTAQGDRVASLVSVVMGAFGGRARVFRELLASAFNQKSPSLLDDNVRLVAQHLSIQGFATLEGGTRHLTAAQAFVLTQSFLGVLRAWARNTDSSLQITEIEASLCLLIRTFLAGCTTPAEVVRDTLQS